MARIACPRPDCTGKKAYIRGGNVICADCDRAFRARGLEPGEARIECRVCFNAFYCFPNAMPQGVRCTRCQGINLAVNLDGTRRHARPEKVTRLPDAPKRLLLQAVR